MKSKMYIFAFLVLGIVFFGNAQNIGNLDGIFYQAVAIDEDGQEIVGEDIEGKPLYQKEIGVRFTITKGLNGLIEWEETHVTTTDKYGLFSLIIGHGNPTGNALYQTMLDIPWIDADQFLKVEISIQNDGNYRMVSYQQFMSVPYSFYTDDIADNAITTAKILDSTIVNQDIHSGAIDSRTILNETILSEDIATGAVTTSEILDSTIINEDIHTGAIDSRTIINETILAEDIATGGVTTSEILDSTIINEDIHTSAIDSRTVLNETIMAEDIATGAVTTSEILDNTILNEDIATGAIDSRTILNATVINDDIADNTIDLSVKVTDTLAVTNGGTGRGTLTDDFIVVGNGTAAVDSKLLASADSSILITQTQDSIILSANFPATVVTSDPAGTFVINNLPAGSTYTSNAINSFAVDYGDIIMASVDVSLQGCMMTAYVSQPNVIRISIFNGTGGAVNLGTVNVRVYVIY
ncbi:MAG: hypothetical protein AB7V36_12385 [Bacteroidales bacterium]